ncbi:hypothetical protein SBOR_0925 [Sclerotinia borealis F-4128]|uniref:Uncharacterized protein n=1 Tax=Sclerotinia borealis (strain F-4128) TaxID=1432307 RepID=W9CPD0_SCLBF|nr:hypothetical protein SBOR_0925 [Sclerotinia borealis F-4128]
MAIPIEKLGLEHLLQERVYIKWVDDEGNPYAMGSCLAGNKDDSNLHMKVVCDSERRIHVYFSLNVTYRHNGKYRQMEMLLAVPPHGDFKSSLKFLSISGLDDLSSSDASDLHEAGISKLEHIILLPFDLRFTGFVVRKEKKFATIVPDNPTSSKLIRTLISLSRTKSFNVYIRPSDYAREHLKVVHELLCDKSVSICEPDMRKIYSQPDIILVDWAKIIYQEGKDRLLSPPPAKHDAQRSTEVQVPQSPPPPPPAKPDCEEPSDVPENLDPNDFYQDSGHVETYPEVDSDEECLAALNDQQLRRDASSEARRSEFKEWLNAAMAINENIYGHRGLTQKLSALGQSVRTSNVRMFDAIRPWCSALFLCDPTDSSGRMDEWFVSDMAKLIRWVNMLHRGAEMTLLMDDFLKLGSSARACDKDQYRLHKVDFLLRVFMEFNQSSISVNGVSRKVLLSRKSNVLGTSATASKRARTAA